MKSLTKNSVFNIVYHVANILFPLITSMYVSRIILAEGIGQVTYAQNITSYFISFAALGFPTYGIREISKARTSQAQLNKTATELILINWIMGAVSSAAFLIMVFSPLITKDRALFLCCGLQLFLNVLNIDWFYQGLEEYTYIVCRSLAVKALSVIAVFCLVKERQDYVLYALISSIAVAGNYLLNVIHARKFIRLDFHALRISRHIRPLLVFAAAILFSSIYSRLDITMLGAMSTKEATGLYSCAHRLVNLISGVCASLTAVFLPRLSYYYAKERERFLELIKTGIRVLSFIVVPMVTGLFILAPQAVVLAYGDAFRGSIPIIRVLCVLIIIKAFGDLLCYQLSIATGSERKRLPAYAAAAGLNVVINAMLIPVAGGVGAAVASVTSELVLNVYLFIKMRKLVQYEVDGKAIWQAIVSSAVMSVPVIAIVCTGLSLILKCILAVLLGGITYLIVNHLLGNVFMRSMIHKMMRKLQGLT